MNRKTCTNLMKDCYAYLNATNLQGRNMLDMRRMKKFQKNKEEIQKRLSELKRKLAQTENQDEIIEALENYQTKLQAAMKLKKEDFTGEGANDFKYGFKMPLKCVNDTNCEWICQKMIKHDGIADDVEESDQNTKIEDLETDDEQQFETDLVIIDDSDEEEEETDSKPRHKRRLLATDDLSIVYDVDGYVADDDAFDDGTIVIDEPAMAEGLVIPEDSVDPEGGSSTKSGFPTWVMIVGVIALLAIVGGAVWACKSKSNQYDTNTEGIDMPEMHMTEMNHDTHM